MSLPRNRAPFFMRFNRRGAQLRVQVIGDSTLDNTLAYWHGIVGELEQEPADQLLLIDELFGEPLTESEWFSLVRNMANRGLERVRIAHVKPHGLQKIEHCEIFARDAGFDARVFDDEHAAEIWLRYGETAPRLD